MTTETVTTTGAAHVYDILTSPAMAIIQYGVDKQIMPICVIGFGLMVLISMVCYLVYVGMWCFAALSPITIGWAVSVWVSPAVGSDRVYMAMFVTTAFIALYSFLVWSTLEIEVEREVEE